VRFTIEQHFAGPLERVESAFVDPEFLQRLSELPKLGQPQLIHQVVAGDLVHQWVQYRFVGEVNAAVRRVVDPARLTWVEESTLDRRTHDTGWKIEPDHYKHLLKSSGTFRLVEDGPERTKRVTEAEIKVSVPFVGGKVEQAIVSGLREHAVLEEQVMAEWLARSQGD
jgi:hypothetical protein